MKATITSKGQITIPKTIRDVLELKEKDEIEFRIQPNGKVSFEKAKELNVSSNIFDMLLDFKMKIAVVGVIGHGKSFVIREAVERKGYQTIMLREPHPELENVFNNKQMIKPTEQEYAEYLSGQDIVQAEHPDIAIIEEVHRHQIHPTSITSLNYPLIMTALFDKPLSSEFLEPFPVTPDVIIRVKNSKISEIVKVNARNLSDSVYVYRADESF